MEKQCLSKQGKIAEQSSLKKKSKVSCNGSPKNNKSQSDAMEKSIKSCLKGILGVLFSMKLVLKSMGGKISIETSWKNCHK